MIYINYIYYNYIYYNLYNYLYNYSNLSKLILILIIFIIIYIIICPTVTTRLLKYHCENYNKITQYLIIRIFFYTISHLVK